MLIYKITNTVNGKIYIGQTTKSLSERKRGYWIEYKYKTANCRLIIKAMKKYGFGKFIFEVLKEDILSKEEMDDLERFYIQKFNSTNKSVGYNIELGGNSVGKHAESTKLKISIAQQGSKNHMFGKTGKLSPSSKPIIDLTTGKIYDSATEFCKLNDWPISEVPFICKCCTGQRMSTKGRVFRRIKNGEIEILPKPTTTKSLTEVIDLTTNKRYIDAHECAEHLHVRYGAVLQACQGKFKINGHELKYGESKKYLIYSFNKANNNVLQKYQHMVNTVPRSIIKEIR